MSRWWRAYDEALHDPKLIALPDKLHRAWFNLLCIASKHGGILPAMSVVAIELRVSLHRAAEWVTALVLAGLFDELETGKFAPHNWSGRQFQSDVSTDRVKRFRERERNVSETPPETEADTEPETEKKTDSRTVAVATRPKVDQPFDEFWKAYPKREGANPRKPALAVFLAKLKAGATAEEILAGTKACAIRDRDKIGTPYIPQAARWLRDERWRDYLTPSATGPPNGWRPGLPTDAELRAKYAKTTETAHVADSSTEHRTDETAGRAGVPGELFREGDGVHPSEQLGVCGNGQQPGTQRVGDVLHRPPRVDPSVSAARDDDDAGAVAPMVRS